MTFMCSQGCVQTTHIARLFEFKPGKTLDKVRLTTQLCYEVGSCAGRMDNILKTFPTTEGVAGSLRNSWDLCELPGLRGSIDVITSPEQRALVEEVLDQFEACLARDAPSFSRGHIHGDLNECNILVEESKSSASAKIYDEQNAQNDVRKQQLSARVEHHVCAIIDFGDATHGPYVFEVAIAMAYAMLNTHGVPPMDAARAVLAGYLQHVTLSHAELGNIRLCVCARFAQSLIMGRIAFSREPENEYILRHAGRIWPVLKHLWQTPNTQVLKEILNTNQGA
ncbi:hypothetical protein EGW08_010250 [Elysia chlorotica]|uniref:Hydroxylysine kinase n=1 Tax=Elysia chlorotica TaxID=188477 RepID=A0A433TKD2_ELYCH|nr:hypothetical protein EGW08_010250 [Elysia chlorotica]